jgi:DNA-directed RNA polymerase specialized sigma24 family protein
MSVDSTSAPARRRARGSAGASLPSLDEMRAHRAADEGMEAHRSYVMNGVREKLRKLGAEAPHQELDAGYNAAWNSLIALRASGESVESEVGWLIITTFRRVIDWLRLEHWDLRERDGVDSDGIAELLAEDEGSLEKYVDQQRQLRSLLEAFRHEFNPRETLILFYAYVLDLPRKEIASRLDMPLKRLNKLLDGYEVRDGHGAGSGEAVRANGLKEALAQHIDVIASGDWCKKHGSLIRAHALGWFEPGSAKYTAATEHLRSCSACRRYYQARCGIAMLLPPVSLPILDSSHGIGLIDQFLAAGRAIANGARSVLGMGGPSDAAVATGAGAGGTAVAGTLLGGAGAKVAAAACAALVAGVCAVVGVHAMDGDSAARSETRPPATVATIPLTAQRPPVPSSAGAGGGTLSLFASGPLLADPLWIGGRTYDFIFENQGATPTRRHTHRHRHAAAARQSTPPPAPAPTQTTATPPAPAPAPTPTDPAPAPSTDCQEFAFESCG